MRILINEVGNMTIGLKLYSGATLRRALKRAGIRLDRECWRNGKRIGLDTKLEQGDIIEIPPIDSIGLK